MVAVTKPKAVPAIEFSTAKEHFARELAEEGQERDASSWTPKAGGDPMHVDEEKPLRLSPMRWVILWQKIPGVKKGIISSQPRGNHNVYTLYPKDPHCEVCKKTNTTRARCRLKLKKRVDGIAPSERGKRQKRYNRAKCSHELVQSIPMKTKETSETTSCLQSFFLRHRNRQ